MIYPNGHVDYLMYKNGGPLIGIAKVTMPTIKYKTVTASGAGLMTINIEFSSVADAIVQLGTNEWHDVSLYAADQYFDSVSRKEEIEQNKFDLSIRPTETSAGTIATASAADASGVYSVCKYTVYKNGAKVIDIDQFSQQHEVNGVDNAAPVRKAMGMT